MQQVSTTEEIHNASQKAITALYGDVSDFRINKKLKRSHSIN